VLCTRMMFIVRKQAVPWMRAEVLGAAMLVLLASEPLRAASESATPDAAAPGATEPEAAAPGVGEADAALPGATEPEPAVRDATEPGSAPPAAPVAPSQSSLPLETEPTEPPPEPKPNRSWELELGVNFGALGGADFNDSNVFIYQQPGYAAEAVALPELGSGPGFSLGLSYGVFPAKEGALATWFGFRYSATWLGAQSSHTAVPLSSAVLHELDFPVAIGARASKHFIPYFEADAAVSFMIVPNVHGLVDQDSVRFDADSALFLGNSYGFGLGSLYCSADLRFCVDAFLGYRAFVVSSINGVKLAESLDAGGWTARLGPAILF
jgi:hypothetical protein